MRPETRSPTTAGLRGGPGHRRRRGPGDVEPRASWPSATRPGRTVDGRPASPRRALGGRPARRDQAPRPDHSARTPPVEGAPWFWSDRHGRHVEVVGKPTDGDTAVVRGEFGSRSFSVFGLRDGVIVGAASVDDPTTNRAARRMIDRRTPVEASSLEDPNTDLRKMLRGLGGDNVKREAVSENAQNTPLYPTAGERADRRTALRGASSSTSTRLSVLDEGRFAEWLDMLADDLDYWMPRQTNRTPPSAGTLGPRPRGGCFYDETKASLDVAHSPIRQRCCVGGGSAVSNTTLRHQRRGATRRVGRPVRLHHRRSRGQVGLLVYRSRLEREENVFSGKRTDVLAVPPEGSRSLGGQSCSTSHAAGQEPVDVLLTEPPPAESSPPMTTAATIARPNPIHRTNFPTATSPSPRQGTACHSSCSTAEDRALPASATTTRTCLRSSAGFE